MSEPTVEQGEYRTTVPGVKHFPYIPRTRKDCLAFMGVWCVQCEHYGPDDGPYCEILTGALLCERTALIYTAEGHPHCPHFMEVAGESAT